MNMNAGGQTIADRINAARFGLAGHMLAKAVCKATTEEQLGPKKKHLDYLLHCTEEPNISIPQLANLILDRLQHPNWVVVFKSLVSIHHLMLYGNERFIQYLASANSSFSLNAFLDNKSGVQGYDMSTYIRRYSKYLNQKALSYRSVAFDFCKVKRGKDDGVLRKMPTEKLLKTLPVIQDQMDALLEFDCSPNELTNAVISSCFVLLFRDLIRLFACYNDGIINMLEKYFDMNKKMCKDALDIYKKFLVRMDKVATFLKVAENVGIPKGEIPDLTKAPASLLDALEQHLDNLEGKPGKSAGSPSGVTGSGSIHAGLMTLSQTEHSLNEVDEKEKQRAILEEQQAMEEIRKKREQQAALQQQQSFTGSDTPTFGSLPKGPSAASTPTNGLPPPIQHPSNHNNHAAAKAPSKPDLFDLFDLDMNAGMNGSGMNPSSMSSDPFGASSTTNTFNPNAFSQPPGPRNNMPPQALFNQQPASSNPFGSPTSGFPPVSSMQSPAGAGNVYNPFAMSPSGAYPPSGMGMPQMGYNNGMPKANGVTSPLGQQTNNQFDPDFGSVFGGQQAAAPFGAGMVPMKPPSSSSTPSSSQPKLIQSNVDTSLANLAANLNLGTMGSYGVRPSMVTQSAFPVGAPGSVFGAQQGGQSQHKPIQNNPMNPVNSGYGGQQQQQQGQYQAMNTGSGTAGVWNPFMGGQVGSPVQQSPTRGQPVTTSSSNDPFGSLI